MNRFDASLGFGVGALLALTGICSASAQQVDIGPGSVVATVQKLRPGEYAWAPGLAPGGPMLLIVNTTTQRAVLYRNGIPIGVSTVSTGKTGHDTPTGVFTILQKHVEHYSSKYDSAPMPYMQRLTWYGVALHAGRLPGYPASHGCIRLPAGFARLLYGETRLGMTVVITDQAAIPRVAPTAEVALSGQAGAPAPDAKVEWQPEKSAAGPVSVIVSIADHRAIVLRNGIRIGSAPVTVEGPAAGTWAYALRSIDGDGQHWLRVRLSGEPDGEQPVPREEWRRFAAPEQFRRAVAGIVEPGTTIIVTPDSLRTGAPASWVTVIDSGPPANDRDR
jgi:hypothetical protein